MKITEIRGYQVGFPLPDPVGNALSFFHRRAFLLVEIVTDSGISGWGEVGRFPACGSGADSHQIRAPVARSETL